MTVFRSQRKDMLLRAMPDIWDVMMMSKGLPAGILLLLIQALISGSPCVGKTQPVNVLVIGDVLPDEAFLWYDPSLRYKMVSYPTWAQIWTKEEIARWKETQRATRNLMPSDFVIELPYHSFGHEYIDAAIRDTVEMSVRCLGASVLLPVPQTTILAQFAPDETWVGPDIEGRFPDRLTRQNSDVLGGMLNRHFSIRPESDPLLDFGGIIAHYHDANLFLMEEPHPLSRVVASFEPREALRARIGDKPWLLRLNLSDTPGGSRLNAGGYVWKCASPLTGLFFFPQGGYVATSVVPGANYVRVVNLKIDEEHEYAWDIISHIILYSAGRKIPDLMVAHAARNMFAQYYRDYAESYRALEFADMVSSTSQTYPIWADLAQAYAERAEAAELYRADDIERSKEIMVGILAEMKNARNMAEQALRLSLFLIHVAEYSAVAATFLVTFSITIHFVSRPRTKEVTTTRRCDVSGKPGTRPVGVNLTRMKSQQKGLLILIAVIIVALPGVAIFWERISSSISWQVIFAGQSWYNGIDEKPAMYTGRLVIKSSSGGDILVDPSRHMAWVRREGSEESTGLISAHRFWPYELERENAPSIPIFAAYGSQGVSVLRRYVGYKVDIVGKSRVPHISLEDGDYPIQDIVELVPGSIRAAG